MTATFKHDQIEFIYPENWSLTSNIEADSFPGEVSLETPEGGFWSLLIFPPNADPTELLDKAKQGLIEQYEDVEFQSTSEPADEIYDSISAEAFFYCLDFLVTAQLNVITTPNHILVICSQAESREFDEKRDVFAAMTASLLKNISWYHAAAKRFGSK